jgi:hypothetical protein
MASADVFPWTLLIPKRCASALADEIDAIYARALEWYLDKIGAPTPAVLTAAVADGFMAATTPPGAPVPPSPLSYSQLCPASMHTQPVNARRYVAAAIRARNAGAAAEVAAAVGIAVVDDARARQSVAGAVMVTPMVPVPLTALPAVIGYDGKTIAALEDLCSAPLMALPIGDTVGTHALFTEAGHTVNGIDRDALAAAVARLEAGSWISLPTVEPQPGRLYRVAVAGTVIASGAPLRMMQSAEPTALFSDATGMMYSAPWDPTTTLCKV